MVYSGLRRVMVVILRPLYYLRDVLSVQGWSSGCITVDVGVLLYIYIYVYIYILPMTVI
jgi:hypothetical protein